MTAGTGWMGLEREMLHALAEVGADQDRESKFIVIGEPIYSIGDEVVVTHDCYYLVEGKRCRVSELMNSTSAGVRNIAVITIADRQDTSV